MYDLPLQELNMKCNEKGNVKVICHNTALDNQMPLLGVHLTVHCILNYILHSSECQDDLMCYCSWPPDACTGGTSASENLNTLCILCFASQRSFL